MYTLSDESVKQLDYVLNCIRSACHCVDSRKDANFHSATDYNTESMLHPERYYYFQFRDKFCQIEKIGRSTMYGIRCHNFRPAAVGPHFEFSLEQNVYQREVYGSYTDIDHAIQDFAKICTEIVQYIQPVLVF